MLSKIVGALKSFFSGSQPTQQVENHVVPEATPEPSSTPAPPPEGVFSLDHEWPFAGTKPNMTHVTELVRGTVTEGEHVFYVWEDQKRRHLRTSRGTETFQARRVIWWLEGRKNPEGQQSVRSTCGEDKCIKLDHIELGAPVKTDYRRDVQPPLHTVSKPATVKPKKKAHAPVDRTKCQTAKGWFGTKKAANDYARYRNSPEVRKGRPRQYVYDCPMCDGFHLTKKNPAKWAKHKPKGYWQ